MKPLNNTNMAFSCSGLKINKDTNKDLQQSINRTESNKLKRLLKIQDIDKELKQISITLAGMNPSVVLNEAVKVSLFNREAELKESRLKILSAKPSKKPKRRITISYQGNRKRRDTGDSSNQRLMFTTATSGQLELVEIPETKKQPKSNWHGRTAQVSCVDEGKSCKYDHVQGRPQLKLPKQKGKELTIKQCQNAVFNARTDIPRNKDYQHMSNVDFVAYMNSDQRLKDIEQVMAQPEKGIIKKQGGNPNNAGNTNKVLCCVRPRSIKGGVQFVPMGCDVKPKYMRL